MFKNMLSAKRSWPCTIVLVSIVGVLAHVASTTKAQSAPASAPVTLTTTLVKTGLFPDLWRGREYAGAAQRGRLDPCRRQATE